MTTTGGATCTASDAGGGNISVYWQASHQGLWANRNGTGVDWDFQYVVIYECDSGGNIAYTLANGKPWTGTQDFYEGYNKPGFVRMRAFYKARSNGSVQYLDDVLTSYSTGAPANQPPTASNLGNGTPAATTCYVQALYQDPEGANGSAVFRWSTSSSFSTYTDQQADYTVSSGSYVTTTLTGLPPSTTIYVRCFPHDGTQFGASPAEISFTTPSNVTVTQNPSASATGTSSTKVSIYAQGELKSDGSGTAYIDVYNVSLGNAYVGRINAGSGTIVNSSLTPDTNYTYRVECWKSDGTTKANADQAPVGRTKALPSTPTLSGTVGTTSNDLAWSVSTGADGYDVLRGGSVIGSTTTVRSYTDSSPVMGSANKYTVKGKNSAASPVEYSAPSNEVSLTNNRPPTAPGTPSVSPNPVTTNGTITWSSSNDPDSDAITYKLEVLKDGVWTLISNNATSGTVYDFSSINSGTTYVRVTATDSKGLANTSGPVESAVVGVRHTLTGDSTMAGAATLTPGGVRSTAAIVNPMFAVADLAALGLDTKPGFSSLQGSTSLISSGAIVVTGPTTLVALASMSVVGRAGTVLLAGEAALTPGAVISRFATAALVSSGVLLSSGETKKIAASVLAAFATMSADDVTSRQGAVALVAGSVIYGAFSVSGTIDLLADSALSETVTVSAPGAPRYFNTQTSTWDIIPFMLWDGTEWRSYPVFFFDSNANLWKKAR